MLTTIPRSTLDMQEAYENCASDLRDARKQIVSLNKTLEAMQPLLEELKAEVDKVLEENKLLREALEFKAFHV